MASGFSPRRTQTEAPARAIQGERDRNDQEHGEQDTPARGSGTRFPRPHGRLRQQRDVDPWQVRPARVRLRRLLEEDRTTGSVASPIATRLITTPETMWSTRNVDRGHRVHRCEERAAERSEQQAEHHAAGTQSHALRGRACEERDARTAPVTVPDHHETFEADVHDAGALAEQAPEPGEVEDREVRERDPDRGADVGRDPSGLSLPSRRARAPRYRGARPRHRLAGAPAAPACASRSGTRRRREKIKIPCRMITNSLGTSVSICSAVSPRDSDRPQDRGEHDPDRVVLRQERHGDPA